MGYSDPGNSPGHRWYDSPGKIMCCICFGQFTIDELAMTKGGWVHDICIPCAYYDGFNLIEDHLEYGFAYHSAMYLLHLGRVEEAVAVVYRYGLYLEAQNGRGASLPRD